MSTASVPLEAPTSPDPPASLATQVATAFDPHLVTARQLGNPDAAAPRGAALAGESAAQVYNLKILFNTVEDRDDNTTRFVVVGRKLFPASGKDKTSVLVSAKETETPGVLLLLLAPLSKHGVNMTRIESRPSRKRKWDYVFFLDLDGHAEDAHVRKALDDMKAQASLFKILGSFPKAIL